MSEVSSRFQPARGRGSGRGGRGGFAGRGGRAGGGRTTNGHNVDSDFSQSADDGSDYKLIELRKRYGADAVGLVRDVFPEWSDADILFALDETSGDISATVEGIVSGKFKQWNEVKSAPRPAKKENEPTPDAFTPVPSKSARGGRGHDAAPRNRGKPADRGRRPPRARGPPGPGGANSHESVSTTDAWSVPSDANDSQARPETAPVATPAPPAKSWASIVRKSTAPKVVPTAPSEPTLDAFPPAEKIAETAEESSQPQDQEPTETQATLESESAHEQASQQPVDELAESTSAAPAEEENAAVEEQQVQEETPVEAPAADVDEKVESEPVQEEETPVPETNVAAPEEEGSASAAPLPSFTPAKAAPPTPRRTLNQVEPVRMPTNREVDIAALKFGAFNLGGEETEEPEILQQTIPAPPVRQDAASSTYNKQIGTSAAGSSLNQDSTGQVPTQTIATQQQQLQQQLQQLQQQQEQLQQQREQQYQHQQQFQQGQQQVQQQTLQHVQQAQQQALDQQTQQAQQQPTQTAQPQQSQPQHTQQSQVPNVASSHVSYNRVGQTSDATASQKPYESTNPAVPFDSYGNHQQPVTGFPSSSNPYDRYGGFYNQNHYGQLPHGGPNQHHDGLAQTQRGFGGYNPTQQDPTGQYSQHYHQSRFGGIVDAQHSGQSTPAPAQNQGQQAPSQTQTQQAQTAQPPAPQTQQHQSTAPVTQPQPQAQAQPHQYQYPYNPYASPYGNPYYGNPYGTAYGAKNIYGTPLDSDYSRHGVGAPGLTGYGGMHDAFGRATAASSFPAQAAQGYGNLTQNSSSTTGDDLKTGYVDPKVGAGPSPAVNGARPGSAANNQAQVAQSGISAPHIAGAYGATPHTYAPVHNNGYNTAGAGNYWGGYNQQRGGWGA